MKTRTLRIILALILVLGTVFSVIPAYAATSVDVAQTEGVVFDAGDDEHVCLEP